MKIGGLQKLTLIDYPGKLAATVFLSGCNFRCPFCYSSELVIPEKIKNSPEISKEYLFNFLEEKKGLLDAIILCGGEPCLNEDLADLAKEIKKRGFLLKLDTNGSNPEMLKKLVEENLIDYVAMDIKGPRERYRDIVGVDIDINKIEESADFLLKNSIDYEFRTTIVPSVLLKEDFLKVAEWIKGAKRYYLQQFRPEKTIDPDFEKVKPYSDEYLLEIVKAISCFFEECRLRQ